MTKNEFIVMALATSKQPHMEWIAGKMYDALTREGFAIVNSHEGECETEKAL